MADVKKINGYNIKDETARGWITNNGNRAISIGTVTFKAGNTVRQNWNLVKTKLNQIYGNTGVEGVVVIGGTHYDIDYLLQDGEALRITLTTINSGGQFCLIGGWIKDANTGIYGICRIKDTVAFQDWTANTASSDSIASIYVYT